MRLLKTSDSAWEFWRHQTMHESSKGIKQCMRVLKTSINSWVFWRHQTMPGSSEDIKQRMRVLSRYQTMHESRYFHNTMTHQSFIFTCRFVSHALIISTVRVQHKEYESRILTGFCFSSFLLWCCTSTATITPLALLWTGEEWDSLGNKSPDPPPCSQRSWAHVIPLSLSLLYL